MNEAPDARPLFTVYARVAGAIVGFTTRGGYADAVAFMHASQAGRATPEPIAQAEADARTTGGEYAPYMGEGAASDAEPGGRMNMGAPCCPPGEHAFAASGSCIYCPMCRDRYGEYLPSAPRP